MKNNKIRTLVYAALFAALVYIGTLISIPLPFGYFNFGDFFILCASWLIGFPYALASGAIGAMFADLSLGYALYAPATFVIKALVALIAFFVCKVLTNTKLSVVKYTISSVIAELVMVLGYYLFESVIYSSFVVSLESVPGNLLQGAVAVIAGTIVMSLLETSGLADKVHRKLKM